MPQTNGHPSKLLSGTDVAQKKAPFLPPQLHQIEWEGACVEKGGATVDLGGFGGAQTGGGLFAVPATRWASAAPAALCQVSSQD